MNVSTEDPGRKQRLTPDQKQLLENHRRKGRKVIATGFISITTIIVLLYAVYFYIDANDPTKALYFYPPTKNEVVGADGTPYTVENIFPAYDNYDFFHEKKSTNYKTTQELLGKPFDLTEFREDYEFGIMRTYSSDQSIKHGLTRYYIYNVVNDQNPVVVLYLDSSQTVVGLTGPYVTQGEFKDMSLNGANFTEVTRLDQFMRSADKTNFAFKKLRDNVYSAWSVGEERRVGYKNYYNPIFSTTIYAKKALYGLDDLIDYYKDQENYVTIDFSTFISAEAHTLYQTLVTQTEIK